MWSRPWLSVSASPLQGKVIQVVLMLGISVRSRQGHKEENKLGEDRTRSLKSAMTTSQKAGHSGVEGLRS